MTLALAVMLGGILAVQPCSENSKMAPSIQEVKAKYQKQLLDRPGVVSVGIGRDDDGTPVIIVGLDGRHRDRLHTFPKDLDGYRLRVQVTGPYKAQ